MSEDKSQMINESGNEAPARTRTPLFIKKRPFSSLLLSSSTPKSILDNKKSSHSGLEDDTQFWNKVALVIEELENKKVNLGQCVRVSDHHHNGLVSTTPGFKGHTEFHKRVAVSVDELKSKKVNARQCSRVSDDATAFSPLKGGNVYHLHLPLASTNTTVLSGSRVGIDPDPYGSALDRIDLGVGDGEVKSGESGENQKEFQREVMTIPVVDGGEENCLEHEVAAAEIGSCRLVKSHSFSLEKCCQLNDGDSSNLSAHVDSLNSCSCTFCTKVAYIWSDLYYKDVKERISVSMKSQKEASNLAQRYILETEMSRLIQGIPGNVGNTEPDLTSQWKSLFLHMENVFGSETSLLHADLQGLRGIRDDFKMNLEMINAKPINGHPCSSDSSDHVMI